MANDLHIKTGLGVPPAPPEAPVINAQRLAALQAFNARLVCMTVDETSYEEVVKGVRRVVGCDACALFLAGGSSEELELKAARGYEGVAAGLRIRLDDPSSLHAQAFGEEYLVHVDDLRLQPNMAGLDDDMASVLVIPVISNRGPVGVFEFASRNAGAFGPQDIGLCSMAVDQMAYSLENMRLVGELSLTRDAVIRGMAVLAEIRDPCIGGHLSRICAYSSYLAERLLGRMGYHEVTRRFADSISRSAALHDVGKVGIPDDILLKPGKLTADEFDVMKEHTNIGYNILRDSPSQLMAMAGEIAVAHHEKFGGGGYPRGVKGEAIPLVGRICAVADVFDALSSERPYKEAWPTEKALQFIKDHSGDQFDPKCVDVFVDYFDEILEVKERYRDQ